MSTIYKDKAVELIIMHKKIIMKTHNFLINDEKMLDKCSIYAAKLSAQCAKAASTDEGNIVYWNLVTTELINKENECIF